MGVLLLCIPGGMTITRSSLKHVKKDVSGGIQREYKTEMFLFCTAEVHIKFSALTADENSAITAVNFILKDMNGFCVLCSLLHVFCTAIS